MRRLTPPGRRHCQRGFPASATVDRDQAFRGRLTGARAFGSVLFVWAIGPAIGADRDRVIAHERGLDAELTACGDERPAERRVSCFGAGDTICARHKWTRQRYLICPIRKSEDWSWQHLECW